MTDEREGLPDPGPDDPGPDEAPSHEPTPPPDGPAPDEDKGPTAEPPWTDTGEDEPHAANGGGSDEADLGPETEAAPWVDA